MMAFAMRTTTEFAKTCPKIPALVRHLVRCGKPNCRCARGDLHESWRLVWRDASGGQRHWYVRKAEVAAVRAILERRRAERRAWRAAVAEATAKMALIRQFCRELERSERRP